MKYLDTSHSLSQQKDKLLIKKIIQKMQYLNNHSAKECQDLKLFKWLSNDSCSESDTNSGLEPESDSVSSRQRKKKRSTSHHSQKKTKHASKLFNNSNSENSESKLEHATTKKSTKHMKYKHTQVQTDSELEPELECQLLRSLPRM
ncbi:hypothetical protein HD554DRAFT_2037482 [Boletus coccyginus]|nr:hypothetical protein HD554DRAFT_2037482 [Boletus coccyginus]